MVEPRSEQPREPGEVRRPASAGRRAPDPAAPTLTRPPGERYAPPSRAPSTTASTARPRIVEAVVLGAIVTISLALVWGVVRTLFDLGFSLVLAAVGGWLVGAAMRWRAWSPAPAESGTAPRSLVVAAVVLAAATWLGGWLAAWVLAMASLPGSAMSLPDRLAAQPFLGWLGPQLGVLDPIQLVVLAVLAWRAVR